MRIAVLGETAGSERRVALIPATVQKLIQQNHQVVLERGAGAAAFFPDQLYRDAGATMADSAAAACQGAELIVKVQPPTPEQARMFQSGALLISLMAPHANGPLLDQLAAGGVSSLCLELVPRTSKAQSMDVLSSQATVAGYQAVLLAASRMGRLLPMLTTAAGTLTPGKAFIIGAGVAGLQAIATARRLGAVVSAFDIRSVVKEQVQSLGASFVETGAKAEGAGGYAKELATDQQALVLAAIGGHIKNMDLVVTTAAIPGKPAPRLITRAMVESMKPGSIIVDLAADSGGNCELTRLGEDVVVEGVTVLGPSNVPSMLPNHASFMFSKNIQALLDYAIKDGGLVINVEDPIVGPMCVTHGGTVRYGRM